MLSSATMPTRGALRTSFLLALTMIQLGCPAPTGRRRGVDGSASCSEPTLPFSGQRCGRANEQCEFQQPCGASAFTTFNCTCSFGSWQCFAAPSFSADSDDAVKAGGLVSGADATLGWVTSDFGLTGAVDHASFLLGADRFGDALLVQWVLLPAGGSSRCVSLATPFPASVVTLRTTSSREPTFDQPVEPNAVFC